jgi:hypothetical protein
MPVAVWERLVLDRGLPVPFILLETPAVPRAVHQNGAVEERSDGLIVVVWSSAAIEVSTLIRRIR